MYTYHLYGCSDSPKSPLSFVAQGGTEMKSLLVLTVFGSAYGFWAGF